jgi:hypothetical protein
MDFIHKFTVSIILFINTNNQLILIKKRCIVNFNSIINISLIRPTRYFCMVIMWWTSRADALYTVKTSISSCGPCVRTLTKPRRWHRLQIKLTATYLTEILLKVALNTITLTLTLQKYIYTPTVITILSDTPRILRRRYPVVVHALERLQNQGDDIVSCIHHAVCLS